MTTVFKKSLALIIAVVLCATAFIGCLTVNAEEVPTISVVDVTTVPGGLANVRINLENISTICGIDLDVVFPEDVTLNSVNGVSVESIISQYDEEGGNVYITTKNNQPTVKFVDIINYVYNEYNISNSTLAMDINVTAPETLGEYDVTLNVKAANQNLELIENIAIDDGKIVVDDDASSLTLSNGLSILKGSATTMMFKVGFSWEFNGTLDGYGAKVYKNQASKDAGDVMYDTEVVDKSTFVISVSGIQIASIEESFIFVPYAVKDSNIIEGTEIKVSYADYLNSRVDSSDATAETKTKAQALINVAKVNNRDSEAVLTPYESSSTYSLASNLKPASVNENNVDTTSGGSFDANPVINGFVVSSNSSKPSYSLYAKFDYAASGVSEISERGVFVYRAANFTFPTDFDSAKTNAMGGKPLTYQYDTQYVIISGFNVNNISENFVFLPYVKDADGNVTFANAVYLSYADVLLKKLDLNADATTSQIKTASEALTVMDAYATIKGTELYTKTSKN